MRRAIVVRGRLVGPRLIELEEPVLGVEAEVEVVLREAAPPAAEDEGESLIAVLQRKDVEAAITRKVDVEVVYQGPGAPSVAGEDVTESPVVLVRRVSSVPKIQAAPETEPHGR
jgi:hypothetical protein